MRKTISILSVSVLSVFLFVTAVSAYTVYRFVLENVGDTAEIEADNLSGTIVLTAQVDETQDSTLGMSLSQKKLFGWDFISRCNKSIKNNDTVTCTWTDRSKDRYKGTLVWNSKASGETAKTIEGDFWLK